MLRLPGADIASVATLRLLPPLFSPRSRSEPAGVSFRFALRVATMPAGGFNNV